MEKVSDIVREMRKCANAADPSIWGDGRIAGLVRNAKAEQLKYADRIAAAHEREVADAGRIQQWLSEVGVFKMETTTPGNGAKLREALEKIDKIVWDKRRHTKEETEAHRIATEVLTEVNSTSRETVDIDSRAIYGEVRESVKPPIVNAAKLREALEEADEFLSGIGCDAESPIRKLISSALAEPPRNCDRFSTAADAWKAHDKYCDKYKRCHNGCPLQNEEHYSAFDCFEAWLFAETKGGVE